MRAQSDSMTWTDADAPALGTEERSDEAPRAATAQANCPPDPEVVAKPTRRQLIAEYRLRLLEQADRCTHPGEGQWRSVSGSNASIRLCGAVRIHKKQ